ncbi:MAG: ABC transporter permease subunit [Clostridiales bacterium]
MINWTLIKKEIKANYKLFLIFIGVLSMYAGMIVAMFDPKLGESLDLMAKSMPQLFSAFGMMNQGGTLLEFMANYLYNFLFIAFPGVYLILLANRLIAHYVDQGSMSYILATPNTRKKIALTQMKFMTGSLFMLVLTIGVISWGFSEFMFPGELDLPKFILINVALYGLLLFLGGICFCASCIFNDKKLSYGFGGGLVVAFILLQMISQVGDKFEFLKYVTPLTLFDTHGLIAGDVNAIWMFLSLYIAGMAFYFLGMYIFTKKDLPI